MSHYDPKKIEEYQLILLKNPRSPVFAALAEAYRKMGLLDEALEVTQKGVKHNPEFVSGLVAHSKILYELRDYREALKILTKAHLLKPENLLALRLLSHCYAKLKRYPEALRSFKKLLIVHPNDESALSFIQKWEFLESLPKDPRQKSIELDDIDSWIKRLPGVEQALHLVDSFVHFGDKKAALEITNSARLIWADDETLKSRQDMLYKSLESSQPPSPSPSPSVLDEIQFKKGFYAHLLQRIERRKNLDPN